MGYQDINVGRVVSEGIAGDAEFVRGREKAGVADSEEGGAGREHDDGDDEGRKRKGRRQARGRAEIVLSSKQITTSDSCGLDSL